MGELPSSILGITISIYWLCVGAMVVRVSRRTGRARRVLIPPQRRERLMWVVWVPLVAAWVVSPFVAPMQSPVQRPWIGLPEFARSTQTLMIIRLAASGVAVICLLITTRCWRHMGPDWRMGVDPESHTKLIVDGPFARVRHPIYALSVALMLCSIVVVPTPMMLGVGILHISLMVTKARNEEAFLLKMHQHSYAEYCARTGRFLPRIRVSR